MYGLAVLSCTWPLPPRHARWPIADVCAAPYGAQVASEQGVDLRTVQGTGPGGRIIAENVKNAAAGQSPTSTL